MSELMTDEILKFLKAYSKELDQSKIKGFSDVMEALYEIKETLEQNGRSSEFQKKIAKVFSDTKKLKQAEERQLTLFPHKIEDDFFGIPQSIADSMGKAIGEIDDYKRNAFAIYEREGTKFTYNKDPRQLSMQFKNEVTSAKDADDFFDLIRKRIKNGKQLIHFMAMWNFACMQKSFSFQHIHIDDILATFMTKPESGYFRQNVREDFTASIRTFEKMELLVPVEIDKKGKKQKAVQPIQVMDFRASVENKKRTCILAFIGEILGRQVNKRGRIFPKGIFNLSLRNNASRIPFAYRLATRFDQTHHKPLTMNRSKLIKEAGLIDSDNVNKGQASILLKKTLDKFIEVGCLTSYNPEKITTNNSQKFTLVSPYNEYHVEYLPEKKA